ncbi:MAG: hypothetical protein P8X57_08430 [Cyclobacteriaceae bacterium]
MAKIQVRLTGNDLREKLPEFSGQKINIVKKNQSVSYIYFDRVESEIIKGRNMRLSRVSIPLTDIREIIIDRKA